MNTSDTVIQVQNLGKEYRIGALKEQLGRTLRESIVDVVSAPLGKIRALVGGHASAAAGLDERLWALRDVSFEVRSGEVVGIIGRNGAGKSTLLKLLTRITPPTCGRARIRGRVGSLLEVGTGFHSELTGRENTFLSGSILGMSRVDTRRRFDEIVAFAGVERFVDTPVKHYSTGMYLRLAFAVAAHLEPDILIVDEVLAVGDAAFQKRCLEKLESVGSDGRTVLFVSHSMTTIARLCSRAILLEDGCVAKDGPAPMVVGHYMRSDLGTTAWRSWSDPALRPGDEVVRLVGARVVSRDGDTAEAIDIGQPVGIEVTYEVCAGGHHLDPHLVLHNEQGIEVLWTRDLSDEDRRQRQQRGTYASTVWIPGHFLAEGQHGVTVGIASLDHPVMDHVVERDAVSFQIFDPQDGTSARGDYTGHVPGVVRPLLQWRTVPGAPAPPVIHDPDRKAVSHE